MRRGSLAGRNKGRVIRGRRAYPHAAGGWSLSAASDSVGAALGGVEVWYFCPDVENDGDYYELCDVVAGLNVLCRIASVMQADFDGAAISAIYDSGAVTEHQMLLNTGGAAYKQHANMTTGHSNMHAGIAYPVGAHGHRQVVFQGEVNAGIVFVGLARLRGTIIKRVIKQCWFLSVSLFVFFEDELGHVCRVEVSIAVEAAACGEVFEVKFQLADIIK